MKKILYVFVFMLLSLGAFCQATTIYLIRHAEKVDNSKNPDLSKVGLERAEHWKTILSQVPLKAVYSTDFLRTVQTATPTATSKNLEIIKYDPKTLDLEQLKKEHKGQAILIVGHSNTTPDLVNRIINQKVYAPIDDTVCSSEWIGLVQAPQTHVQMIKPTG